MLLVAIGIWSAPTAQHAERRDEAPDAAEDRKGMVGRDDPSKAKLTPLPAHALVGRDPKQVDTPRIVASNTLMANRTLKGRSGFRVDEEGIRAALDLRRKEVGDCWTAARAHDPALAPDRTLQIEIAPKEGAAVASVSWVNSGADVLDRCLENAFVGVTFASPEPTTLRTPYTFK
jgi:hypothetical protein